MNNSCCQTVKKDTQYRQLLHHVVRIGADTAKPVRFRGEQQINNWSVRQFSNNYNPENLFSGFFCWDRLFRPFLYLFQTNDVIITR